MIETLAGLMRASGHELLERAVQIPDGMWESMDIGYSTYTGKAVTQLSALQMTAVYACIRIMSGDIAKCPLLVYRLSDDGESREKARDHYLYRLLRTQANPRMSAYRFKRLMQTWVMLDGNSYAELEINGRGQVLAFWPWRPDRVSVRLSEDGRQILSYKYRMDDGTTIERPWYLMLHLRGLETDGVFGLSPVQIARQSIGLALAQEEFASRFYGQGARPGGLLTVPAAAARQKEEIRAEWHKTFGGLSNAHRTAILLEGSKYEPLMVKQADAEFIATKKMGIADISRVYGPPLHKLSELDRATFSNIEEQQLDYVSGALGDTMANWEQEITFACLSEREQQSVYVEFVTEAIIRGRLLDQMQALGTAADKGVMTRNEARGKFNMNPKPGGDSLMVQQQMIPIEMAGKIAQKQQQQAKAQPAQ